ncbi:Syntaxin-3 [Halotydeus destructor]|nr:Syntaxin-3 [Halotydeus destructor]
MVRDRLQELRSKAKTQGVATEPTMSVPSSNLAHIAVKIDQLDRKVSDVKFLYKQLISSPINVDKSQLEPLSDDIRQTAIDIKELFKSGTTLSDSQMAPLVSRYKVTMEDFAAAQINYQDCKKNLIRRQLEITGQKNYEQKLEEMIETGDVAVFVQGIELSQRSLDQVQERNDDLIKLEKNIRELNTMMQDFAILVDSQGEVVDSIDNRVTESKSSAEQGKEQVAKAHQYQVKYWKKMVALIVILIIIAVLVALLVLWVTGVL